MSLIVQKFGGTSVADPKKIRNAARKAIRAQQQGHQVVVVVSAMGKNTDTLVDLAGQVCSKPPAREMDMLLSTGEQVSVALMAMAVCDLGARAVSLTGSQMGIRTDASFTKARIRSIENERIQRFLDDGMIVIAAGFQGTDEERNITTLGRGGSDTTAVALAAVLDADACEIYTDVDGVYTTDPRLLPEARRVGVISYDEMLELASLGAGVLHNRSVEFAKKFGVPIHVRSSFSDSDGTMVVAECESVSSPVSGAALTRDEARVTVLGVPDRPGTSLEVFSRMAEQKIAVDMIVQNVGSDGRANISFTVPRDELARTLDALQDAVEALDASGVAHDTEVSKVSVVGLGMAQQTNVAHRMFEALAEQKINIQMITTSEIKISAIVPRSRAVDALRAVHRAFTLEVPAPDARSWDEIRKQRSGRHADVQAVVARLQEEELETLTLTGISMVADQARLTLAGVPDEPGIAADIFGAFGAAGILVDMIIQGYDSAEGHTSITLTFREGDLQRAMETAKELAAKHALRDVNGSSGVNKLTVAGIGLRSHTNVSARMFRVLADAGINVQMINTSELQVNAVVASKDGPAGLAALQKAFAHALS